VEELTILAAGLENSKRKVKILKTSQAYHTYKRIIIFFAIQQLLDTVESDHLPFKRIHSLLLQAKGKRAAFKNIGGQLIPEQSLNQLVKKIKSGVLNGWDDIHAWYRQQSLYYPTQKRTHALASLWEITGLTRSQLNRGVLSRLVKEAIATNRWIEEQLVASRKKDYQNPFRKLVYDTEKEMNKVMGVLADNPFIAQHRKQTIEFEQRSNRLLELLGTKGQ
jgi:hypothetical protein